MCRWGRTAEKLLQRAAGWCKAAQNLQEITPEHAAEYRFPAECLEGGKVSIARDPSVTGERIVGCAEWPLTGGKWSGTASVLARLYVETGIFCFQAAHEPGWMQICFCAFWLFGQARFWNAWKYFQNRNPEMNRYTDQEGIICSLLERKS